MDAAEVKKKVDRLAAVSYTHLNGNQLMGTKKEPVS